MIGEQNSKHMIKSKQFSDASIRSITQRDPIMLRKLLIALNPMNWFMVRNTRERLSKMGYINVTMLIGIPDAVDSCILSSSK
jgi:hypothetical protein